MAPRPHKTLGTVLRAARERKELTVRALAERVGVHYSTITRFEADEIRPKPDVIARLAKALGVRRDELLALTGRTLPDLAPYLRAKYDLSDEAIAELEVHFAAVRKAPAKRRQS